MPGKCQVLAKPNGSIAVIYSNHSKFSDEEQTHEWFAAQAAKDPCLENAVEVATMDEDDLPWVGDDMLTKHRHLVYKWDGKKIREDKKKIPDR